MPDQTPDSPRSTTRSGDETWADDVLARARARTEAEENTGPEMAGSPPKEATDGTSSTSLLEPSTVTSREPGIVTREDLTGGPTRPIETLDGTFVVPDVAATPRPPSEFAEHPVPGPSPEVDLGMPGTIRSARRTILEWGMVLIGALVLALIKKTRLVERLLWHLSA